MPMWWGIFFLPVPDCLWIERLRQGITTVAMDDLYCCRSIASDLLGPYWVWFISRGPGLKFYLTRSQLSGLGFGDFHANDKWWSELPQRWPNRQLLQAVSTQQEIYLHSIGTTESLAVTAITSVYVLSWFVRC